MHHGPRAQAGSTPDKPLTRVIDGLAHLLPAQGPISIFIHHNTLHAFEHLPFEVAVEHAAVRLGREPYLAESRYRDKLAAGRIRLRDVEALLREHLAGGATEDVAGVGCGEAVAGGSETGLPSMQPASISTIPTKIASASVI